MLQVQESLCTGCGTCLEVCPAEAIQLQGGRARIDQALCDECGICSESCPEDAILVVFEPTDEVALTPGVSTAGTGPTATSSREIVTIKVPPPPAIVEPAPSLARRAMPAIGAALAWLGQEVGPRLVRLAVDIIEDRLARSSAPLPMRETKASSGGQTAAVGGGRRQRRRRRGRF